MTQLALALSDGQSIGGENFFRRGPEVSREDDAVRVMDFINVAGVQYHCGPEYFQGLKPGVPVRLMRERDNPHDANAVAVYIGFRKVGYIPKHSNRAVSGWMDRGARVTAEVSAVRLRATPWNRVLVRVKVNPAAA